jgi:hypothetical protein
MKYVDFILFLEAPVQQFLLLPFKSGPAEDNCESK